MQVSKVAPPQASTEKKPQLVNLPCKGEHILGPEPCRYERLMGIPEGGIGDKDLFWSGRVHWGNLKRPAGIYSAS